MHSVAKPLAALAAIVISSASCAIQTESGPVGEHTGEVASAKTLLPNPLSFYSMVNESQGATAPPNVYLSAYRNSTPYIVQISTAAQAALSSYDSSPNNRTTVAAVSWDHSLRADVFWIGTNREMQHAATGDGGVTWGNDSLGKPTGSYELVGRPAAASGQANRLDIFAIARDTTNGTYHIFRKYYNGAYSSWFYFAAAPSNPAAYGDIEISAISWGPSRIDVFTRETAVGLRHYATADYGLTWANDLWNMPWSPSGNHWSLTSWGDQRIDIFNLANSPTVIGHFAWDHNVTGWDTLANQCGSNIFTGLGGADGLTFPAPHQEIHLLSNCPQNVTAFGKSQWTIPEASWAGAVPSWSTAVRQPEPAGYYKSADGAVAFLYN